MLFWKSKFYYVFIILATNADELLALRKDKPTHVNRCKADIIKEALPTSDWQKEQVIEFTNVRMKIARHITLVKNETKNDQEKIKTPSTKNEFGNYVLKYLVF